MIRAIRDIRRAAGERARPHADVRVRGDRHPARAVALAAAAWPATRWFGVLAGVPIAAWSRHPAAASGAAPPLRRSSSAAALRWSGAILVFSIFPDALVEHRVRCVRRAGRDPRGQRRRDRRDERRRSRVGSSPSSASSRAHVGGTPRLRVSAGPGVPHLDAARHVRDRHVHDDVPLGLQRTCSAPRLRSSPATRRRATTCSSTPTIRTRCRRARC